MPKEYTKLFEEKTMFVQIRELKEKINEIIDTINFIANYYKTNYPINQIKVIK